MNKLKVFRSLQLNFITQCRLGSGIVQRSFSSRTFNESKKRNYLFPIIGGFIVSVPFLLMNQNQKTIFATDEIHSSDSNLQNLKTKQNIFDVFASIQEEGGKLMTPLDVLKAISLNSNLNPNQKSIKDALNKITTLFSLSDPNFDGTISFEQFIYFQKLLATHPKHFEIAFSMYDLDGSGSLDKEEFQKVMGAKKTGNGKPNIDSVWNKKSTISLQEFSTFISDLQSSIHLAQFESYDEKKNGTISGYNFAKIFLSHSNLLKEAATRLTSLPQHLAQAQITYHEYSSTEQILSNIKDIDIALKLTPSKKSNLEKDDFSRAVRAVTGSKITETQIEILFHLLDFNGNGELSRAELLLMGTKQSAEDKITNPFLEKIMNFIDCVRYND